MKRQTATGLRKMILVSIQIIVLTALFTGPVWAQETPVAVTAVNNSYATPCAEEDNVNIPFTGQAEAVVIRALHPTRYQIQTYNCDPDFTGCDFGDDVNFDFPDPFEDKKIYDDGEIYVLVTRQASWWRPTGMRVRADGWNEETDIHLIEIGHKVQGANDWPLYLALYADGNLRLIPHPVLGSPAPCFGSSVLVGSAEIAERPVADIAEVQFQAGSKTLALTYNNGDRLNIILEAVSRSEARIKIELVQLQNPQTPFITFRSMYVAQGNADVDRVGWSENGQVNESPVMDFTQANGTAWQFFRAESSRHNQSAPDMEIEFY